MNLRDKVRGCFLGIGIGDALGKPVECWTAQRIAEKFGRITNYFVNIDHKYFDGMPAGSTTDDLQLSLAVARAFIDTGKFDLDAIAEEHCCEFVKSINGWGTTTREAVANMIDRKHWSEAANATSVKGTGVGNGVAMKVAPIGLYMGLTNPECKQPQFSNDVKSLVKFATMTHLTNVAITSGIVQTFAIIKCFLSDAGNFDVNSFIKTISSGAEMGKKYLSKTITQDNIATRLKLLADYKQYSPERIISEFKGGPYVYESLPFTLMFFVRNPHSIDIMYDCISAGGDTDSTGAMIGALLGALHGESVFPKHLVDGLQEKDEVLRIADRFYQKFVN